jgi:hypothetical protein
VTRVPTFSTPGPIIATVVVAGAQVRISASERTDTVVLVEPIDKTSQSDVRVARKTKVDFAGGQLSVKTTASGDKNGSVAITIDLPAGSGLVSYLAHSDVHAHGSLGECELHMASGRVQLDRIDALQANVAAGEVTIGRAPADLDLSSGRGGFDIDRGERSVTARMGNGAIRVGLLARGQAELVSHSGNIEVGISQRTAVRVDADSTIHPAAG